MTPFTTATAREILDRITASGDPAVEVADVDWGLLLPLYRQALPFPLFDVLAEREQSAPQTPTRCWTSCEPCPPTPAPTWCSTASWRRSRWSSAWTGRTNWSRGRASSSWV